MTCNPRLSLVVGAALVSARRVRGGSAGASGLGPSPGVGSPPEPTRICGRRRDRRHRQAAARFGRRRHSPRQCDERARRSLDRRDQFRRAPANRSPPRSEVARDAGAQPLVLLNGRRVSSYRELRDIPIEAIQRVDILPEEVALKYGYRADQRVVNVVLKSNFRSTTAQVAGNSSAGGFNGGSGDATRMKDRSHRPDDRQFARRRQRYFECRAARSRQAAEREYLERQRRRGSV